MEDPEDQGQLVDLVHKVLEDPEDQQEDLVALECLAYPDSLEIEAREALLDHQASKEKTVLQDCLDSQETLDLPDHEVNQVA